MYKSAIPAGDGILFDICCLIFSAIVTFGFIGLTIENFTNGSAIGTLVAIIITFFVASFMIEPAQAIHRKSQESGVYLLTVEGNMLKYESAQPYDYVFEVDLRDIQYTSIIEVPAGEFSVTEYYLIYSTGRKINLNEKIEASFDLDQLLNYIEIECRWISRV